MAKEFISPEIVSLSLEDTEGLFGVAGSGYEHEEKGDWDINCRYDGHNTGHHSVVHVQANHHGTNSGECLTMTFRVNNGFKIDRVQNASGTWVNILSENRFTITRNGHFNPNEAVGFCFELVVKNSPYHGSIGKTGEYRPCDIECVSYTGA